MAEDTAAPPGAHKLNPRQMKIIAGGGVVLAGYLYYRNKQAAAAAAAAPSPTSATDTTGLGLDAGAGPGVYGAQGSAASNTIVGSYSTNQDWYNAALTACEAVGYDALTASTALSAYLAHQPLTTAQQAIVMVGLAAAGTPPVGTFTIITQGTGAGTPGAPGSTVPRVPPPEMGPPNTPSGLQLVALGKQSFALSWDPVQGAYEYRVYVNTVNVANVLSPLYIAAGGNGGTGVPPGWRPPGIQPGGHYIVTVTAVAPDGVSSAHSAPFLVHTKSK